jgi:sugar phosphate isomerase/epimerase
MSKRIIPSLLVTETYFPVKDEKGFAAGVVEKLAEEGFYGSFEIGDGYDKEDRKRILEVKEKNNVIISQWLTYLTYKNNLDVSSIDTKLRLESVKQIKENLYLAAECGASYVAFIPGHDPGASLREQGFEAFYESLCAICEEASKYDMNISFEVMDREVHKKRLVGLTSESVQLITKVRETHKNIGLAFDTAHASLNGEDLFKSLELAKSHIHQLHFSNAVLDPKSELYGDNHMPIGDPGYLNVEKMSSILRKAEELGIQSENGLRVAIEVRGTDSKDYHANEKTIRTALESALNLVGTK